MKNLFLLTFLLLSFSANLSFAGWVPANVSTRYSTSLFSNLYPLYLRQDLRNLMNSQLSGNTVSKFTIKADSSCRRFGYSHAYAVGYNYYSFDFEIPPYSGLVEVDVGGFECE